MNLFFPLFIAGLVTSVHCVAMCGTMVVTYGINANPTDSWFKRLLPHLAYQGAKVLSYMAVGLVLGGVGSLLNLGGIRGWVTIVAGAFMIAIGFSMTTVGKSVRRYLPQAPAFYVKALGSLRRKAKSDVADGKTSLSTPITFGLMTGLMPCAPLQAAQLAAAGAGSPAAGAIAMLGFALGTLPLMLVFGAVSSKLGERFKKNMAVVGAIVILVLGGVMLDRGATLLGFPLNSSAVKMAFAGEKSTTLGDYRVADDGVVEVDLVIDNSRFSPQSLAIPENRPVRIRVDRRESNGCSAQLAIPQLDVFANLADNAVTFVDVPASAAGTYTLTCGMGMMSGQLIVYSEQDGAPAASAAAPLADVSSSGGASCACCGGGSAPVEPIEGTAVAEGGVQRITIDLSKGYYDPNRIVLAAGVPTELTFGRGSGCTSEVFSRDLDFSADLSNGPVTVKLDALEPGEYEFFCGMEMVFGTVVVR